MRATKTFHGERVDMMTDRAGKIAVKVTAALLVAVFSIFVVSKWAGSPDSHRATLESLDEKKTTVMELTAASTAASAAITLLPGDTATPIAEKLIDLSGYFLIVLCAIYLEKYLVTITGYAAFTILIPLACGAWIAGAFTERAMWKTLAKKLVIFGLAIFLVIPASVRVSNLIETTYEASIQETIDSAKNSTELIDEGADEESAAAENSLSGIFSKVADKVTEVKDGVLRAAESILNRFVEALAVMLVTSCVIPVLVLAFFVWLVKVIIGVDIEFPGKKTKTLEP